MNTYSDIHFELEKRAEQMKKEESEEAGKAVVEELIHLILKDADILISGIAHEGEKGAVDPAGFYGPSGKFYVHIFSSKLSFDHSGFSNPMLTKLKELLDQIFEREEIGGLSLNYNPQNGTILIHKKDIEDGLEDYLSKLSK